MGGRIVITDDDDGNKRTKIPSFYVVKKIFIYYIACVL